MREFLLRIFLTLVVAFLVYFQSSIGLAAPNDNLKPDSLKESIQDVNDPALSENILSGKKDDQIIQFTAGYLGGKITKKFDSGSQTAIGFTYDWKDIDQNFYSVSAQWLSSKAAWLEWGKKFLIFQENLYEPYYKLSLSHFLDPDDAVAGITRIDSFKGSVSFGFLDLWTMGRILNFECGIHWGIPGLAYHAQAGFQWPF